MQKPPLRTALLSFVLLMHLIFLCFLLISPAFSPLKKERKHLLVKTVVHSPSVQTLPRISSQPAPEPKKKAPQKVPSPSPPPVVKKASPKASPPIKKEPVKQPHPQSKAVIADTLLEELEESIAKIGTSSDKTPIKKKSPVPIPLQMDLVSADEGEVDSAYAEKLVQCLYQQLKLPEYGEVVIQLHLHQDGTVGKIIVLKAHSQRNRHYLESTLPQVKFPSFEGGYAHKKESVFVLRFCNQSSR
jgi:hypothetical protein